MCGFKLFHCRHRIRPAISYCTHDNVFMKNLFAQIKSTLPKYMYKIVTKATTSDHVQLNMTQARHLKFIGQDNLHIITLHVQILFWNSFEATVGLQL